MEGKFNFAKPETKEYEERKSLKTYRNERYLKSDKL